jgi:DNA-binding transcriptional LysR family regulator
MRPAFCASAARYRHGAGEIYRWELDKKDQSVVVAVNGPLITNDIGLLTRAALDGVGLAFMSEDQAAPHLANGALVPGPGGLVQTLRV